MQLHQLKRKNPDKKRVVVGRGGKRGKTSGRGHKGQSARAGTSKRPEMREIIKRFPKKRGYRFKSIQTKPAVINLALIEKHFANGEEVTPESLVEKFLVRRKENKIPPVKILAQGVLNKKVIVSGCLFSQSAKEKIEKAGGTVKNK
ncbi:MAG: 50S ribosomal protein L15 [Patescibacteria group bacterium]